MFCVKCGKTADVGNFCSGCFLESNSLFEIDRLDVFMCRICGLDEEKVKEDIRSRIKTENDIRNVKISLRVIGNKIHATVRATGSIDGVSKNEEKKVLVVARKKMCDTHVKLSGGYYEAVIQVRGQEKDGILKRAIKLLPKKSVVSVESLNEGYNIKIMSKSNARAVSKILRKNFDVKDSFKLVGTKKGKSLYRNYYAVR